MTKQEVLEMKKSPSGHYRRVRYSYTESAYVNVPAEILDEEDIDGDVVDDKTLAEWIAKWDNDVSDIEICDIE